jgi:hypothetical protein
MERLIHRLNSIKMVLSDLKILREERLLTKSERDQYRGLQYELWYTKMRIKQASVAASNEAVRRHTYVIPGKSE